MKIVLTENDLRILTDFLAGIGPASDDSDSYVHSTKLNKVVDRMSRGYAEKYAVAPPLAIIQTFPKKEEEKIEDIVGDDQAERKKEESKAGGEEDEAADGVENADKVDKAESKAETEFLPRHDGDGKLKPLQPQIIINKEPLGDKLATLFRSAAEAFRFYDISQS